MLISGAGTSQIRGERCNGASGRGPRSSRAPSLIGSKGPSRCRVVSGPAFICARHHHRNGWILIRSQPESGLTLMTTR